jgi:hypothetical protein
LMSRNDGQHLLTRPRGHSIASPSYSIPRWWQFHGCESFDWIIALCDHHF